MKNNILKYFLTSMMLISFASSCNKIEPHKCESKCSECGNCKNMECNEKVCEIKCSCEEKISLSGYYVLKSKKIKGSEVIDSYITNVLNLKDDNTYNWVQIDSFGKSELSGTYSNTKDSVTLVDGIKEYNFSFKDNILSGTKTINLLKNEFVFEKDDNYKLSSDKGEVNFDDELFGDDINQYFYNYCPSIMIENNRIMHIWYCSNKDSGKVTDYVAYRKGTLHDDGKWSFSEKELVLGPGSSGEWDMVHACDPKVIKGEFKYNNDTYSYLMAYLGCISTDCTKNEVGIAVSKNPNGPFVKIKELNPIGNYYSDYNLIRPTKPSEANVNGINKGSPYDNQWGYGQPSLINVNKKGEVLLFYTKGVYGGTGEYVERWDFSNLNNPIKLNSATMSNVGIVNANGGSDCINNADFVFDPVNNRIYCIKEDFPYPSGNEATITDANTILYYNFSSNDTFLGESLFTKTGYSWSLFNKINPALTGFKRNHNCGLVSDPYGWLINSYRLPVVYTSSLLRSDNPDRGNGQWPFLHTYRLHGYCFDI